MTQKIPYIKNKHNTKVRALQTAGGKQKIYNSRRYRTKARARGIADR